jgi:hypothetical protein
MDVMKTLWPLAMTVSSGSSGVSAPVSMLPERWAEQTGALGQAMMQLFALPAESQQKGAGDLTSRLEFVTQSIGQVYQGANNSAQSVNAVIVESTRLAIEQTLRFCQDLAGAASPADMIGIQAGYVQSQAALIARQTNAIQREFSKLFQSYAPN